MKLHTGYIVYVPAYRTDGRTVRLQKRYVRCANLSGGGKGLAQLFTTEARELQAGRVSARDGRRGIEQGVIDHDS